MLNPEHKKKEDNQPNPVVVEEVTPVVLEPAKPIIEPILEPKIEPIIEPRIEPAEKEVSLPIDEVEEVDDVQEKKNLVVFIVGVVIMIVLLVMVGLVYWYGSYLKSNEVTDKKAEPEALIVAQNEEAAKTVNKTLIDLKREEVQVTVANGAGVSGLASKYAKEFEALEYVKVAVSNADKVSKSRVVYEVLEGVDVEVLKRDVKVVMGNIEYEEEVRVSVGVNSIKLLLGEGAK